MTHAHPTEPADPEAHLDQEEAAIEAALRPLMTLPRAFARRQAEDLLVKHHRFPRRQAQEYAHIYLNAASR